MFITIITLIVKLSKLLGIIKRNFIYLTPDSFVVLYKALVQSHLEVGIGSKCVESASSSINREIRKSTEKGHKISYCCQNI